MATRINNAKNFNGKSYVVTDEITNILNSLKYENGKLMFQGANVQGEQNIGQTASASEVDISGLISFITSGKESNKIVTTDNNGNFAYTNAITTSIDTNVSSASDDKLPTEKAVRAAIDAVQQEAISVVGSNGITVAGSGTEKTIGNTIKLVQRATAAGDNAATYDLKYFIGIGQTGADDSGYAVLNSSDPINIAKDQFLKSADFGWATDGAGTGWVAPANKTAQTTVPVIKMVVYTTTDGTTANKELFIDCTSFYREYEEGERIAITSGNHINAVVGNGIDATVTSAIVVKADTSDKIFTATGTSASVMSVTSDGVKATGIQDAIDLATENAYAKTSTAISAVNAQVEAFESSVNGAIATTTSNVNAKVDGAVTAVNANVSAAVSAVNAKVDTAVSNVNTALNTTVTAVNTNVSAAITAVDGKVDTAISNVNTALSATVTSVNTNVASAINAVDGNISAVITNVNNAITSTVGSINTQVSAVASQVVQIIDEAYSTDGKVTSTTSAKTVTISGVTGKVLAVYGANGEQIYPTITKVTSDNVTTYTLTAEYGPNDTVDSAWSVLHTAAVTYTDATVTSADAVTGAGYVNAGVTNASSVAAVTYDDATITSATAVNAVSYTNASAGDAATAGTAEYNESTTVAALDYKG